MELLSTDDLRPPEGLVAGRIVTRDGAILRHAVARPASSPRGTVTILPGRGEYIERHYETIADLLARDFVVAILDWRGQGLSSRLTRNRLRGHISSFRQYDADLETFMRRVVLPDCPPPHVALAHSMGGLVLLRNAWRHPWFARAVLTSPLIGLRARRVPAWMWRLMATTATLAGLGRLFVPGQPRRVPAPDEFANDRLCGDRPRFCLQATLLQHHPELAVAGPTLGWLRAAIRATDELRAIAARHRPPLFPMLAVAAGRDPLVDREATRHFVDAVGDIALLVLHGAHHNILLENDRLRGAFWAAFDSFMEDLAPLPSPRHGCRPPEPAWGMGLQDDVTLMKDRPMSPITDGGEPVPA